LAETRAFFKKRKGFVGDLQIRDESEWNVALSKKCRGG